MSRSWRTPGLNSRSLHQTRGDSHRYFREVRCFFNWLVATGYLERSPFYGMRNVRLPQRIVRPFSPEELGRLLATCEHEHPIAKRDRAILLTLLDTGVRCSELLQLQIDDIDLPTGRIRVLHGKGNKQRVVPFAERCGRALCVYLQARGTDPGPLFLAANGHRTLTPGIGLEASGLKHMLWRRGKEASVDKVHAHRFRHTFATWAIQHDARELDVQYLLGHASPDMVRRYSASYGSEQAALRHVRFSPADQMLPLTEP